MNNKGFAVSTILYGLSIMGFLIVLVLIGLMASNRSNTKDFVMEVEDELNRFSSKQTVIIPHDNNPNYPQEYFTLDGDAYWYKIELWNGASYRSATFKISPNTIIYFYIGNGSDIPTIACVDGDARENCNPDPDDGHNDYLIMSTATGNGIDVNGINSSKGQVSQGSDAASGSDTGARNVYLTTVKNPYQYNNANDGSKVRISLASMDDEGSYQEHPSSSIASVFYLGGDNSVYTCNGDSPSSLTTSRFTGDQNQQFTVVGGKATNVKYKGCYTTSIPGTYHNALF